MYINKNKQIIKLEVTFHMVYNKISRTDTNCFSLVRLAQTMYLLHSYLIKFNFQQELTYWLCFIADIPSFTKSLPPNAVMTSSNAGILNEKPTYEALV